MLHPARKPLYFLALATLFVALLTACATPDGGHQKGWSDTRRDLEHDFLHYLAFTQLSDDLLQDENLDQFQAAVAKKAVAQHQLEASLTEFFALTREDDEALGWALLRTGQSYLNLACELQGLHLPIGLSPDEEDRVRAHLSELIIPVIEDAQQWLERAYQAEQSPWKEQAEAILAELDGFAEHPSGSCQITAAFWDPDLVESN